jgi:hypothetical protein
MYGNNSIYNSLKKNQTPSCKPNKRFIFLKVLDRVILAISWNDKLTHRGIVIAKLESP